MAGVMGAKEGAACGDEDSDTCGVSLYKASLPWGVCGLSLKVLEGRAGGPPCGAPLRGGCSRLEAGELCICIENITSYHMDQFIREIVFEDQSVVGGPVLGIKNAEMNNTKLPFLTGLSFSLVFL